MPHSRCRAPSGPFVPSVVISSVRSHWIQSTRILHTVCTSYWTRSRRFVQRGWWALIAPVDATPALDQYRYPRGRLDQRHSAADSQADQVEREWGGGATHIPRHASGQRE